MSGEIYQIEDESTKLVIPTLYPKMSDWDFDNNSIFLTKFDKLGKITIEDATGTKKFSNQKDLASLFKNKYNFTYCDNRGSFDALLQVLSNEQGEEVFWWNTTQVELEPLTYFTGTSCIVLGSKGRSRYIINIRPWLVTNYKVETLDHLQVAVNKWIEHSKYLPVSVYSPSGTLRNLLVENFPDEFAMVKKLSRDRLGFFLHYYVGPRQETTFLGTSEKSRSIDLSKAYLRALGTWPSMGLETGVKLLEGNQYTEDAHPASGYLIEGSIPDTHKYSPLPFKNGHITYGVGNFPPVHVTKVQLDALKALPDVKFTILESKEFIVPSAPTYPFKDVANLIENFERLFKDSLYPLDLKTLHMAVSGHMRHVHSKREPNWNTYLETSHDFNPMISGFLQDVVATRIYSDACKYDADSIRVDALCGTSLPLPEGYKDEGTDLLTYYSPVLKDKPGIRIMRDLIFKYRDNLICSGIPFQIPARHSLVECYQGPTFSIGLLGTPYTFKTVIPPSTGCRKGGPGWNLKLGTLLDRRFSLEKLSIEEAKETRQEKGEAPQWLMEAIQTSI